MFARGDLLRMCSMTEFINKNPELIDWCYGIYMDTIEEIHTYDGFVDCSERYDRILYSGSIMKCDYHWYLERVS